MFCVSLIKINMGLYDRSENHHTKKSTKLIDSGQSKVRNLNIKVLGIFMSSYILPRNNNQGRTFIRVININTCSIA